MKYLLRAITFFFFYTAEAQISVYEKSLGAGVANDINTCFDGGYIITGNSGGAALMLKIDSLGNTQWTKYFGNVSGLNPNNEGKRIIQTKDSGFVYVGSNSPTSNSIGIDVTKTDSLGNIKWTVLYSQNNIRYAYDVKELIDGRLLVLARGSAANSLNILLWFNKQGVLKKSKLINLGTGEYYLNRLIVKNDGNIIIAGAGDSLFSGNLQAMVLIADSAGNPIKKILFGGINTDNFFSVLTLNNRLIFSGITASFGNGQSDNWIVICDSIGDTLVTKVLGGPYNDFANDMCLTSDNNFLMCGGKTYSATNGDMCLNKFDTLGNIVWSKEYGNNLSCEGTSVKKINGGYIVCGTCYSSFGSLIYIVRTNELGNINNTTDKLESKNDVLIIRPQPSFDNVFLDFNSNQKFPVIVDIYDVYGCLIRTFEMTQKSYEIKRSEIKNGIYFYKIKYPEGLFITEGKIIFN